MGCPHLIKFTSFLKPKRGRQPTIEKYYSETVHNLCCVHVLCVLGCPVSICLCLFEVSVSKVHTCWNRQTWGTGRNITPLITGYTPSSFTYSLTHSLTHTSASLVARGAPCETGTPATCLGGRKCLYEPSGATFPS